MQIAFRQRRTFHYFIIHYRDFLDFEEAFVFEDFAFEDLIFFFGELLPDWGAGAAEGPPPPALGFDGAGVPTEGDSCFAFGKGAGVASGLALPRSVISAEEDLPRRRE
jgi:hypothetical protein